MTATLHFKNVSTKDGDLNALYRTFSQRAGKVRLVIHHDDDCPALGEARMPGCTCEDVDVTVKPHRKLVAIRASDIPRGVGE